MPDQEPVRWRIRSVTPGESYVLETPLDRATLSFEWRFTAVDERRTTLTQRIVLSGENAAAYAQAVEVGFGAKLLEGMQRIATLIGAAQAADDTA